MRSVKFGLNLVLGFTALVITVGEAQAAKTYPSYLVERSSDGYCTIKYQASADSFESDLPEGELSRLRRKSSKLRNSDQGARPNRFHSARSFRFDGARVNRINPPGPQPNC